ncbi:hypothetical protein [Sphingomonas sp. SRS2]|uniref:hypothetical protein n=1 Tax=Sphingomonas sp. SRS2 TaxID=133190 RepID=UPI000698353D|nr:hypothetical protein [Sphingomonas sp. SRS2]
MRLTSLAVAAALLLATPTLAEVPIDPGQTATIRLSPQGELAYPVPPRLPHAPANFGAILSAEIDEPGLYHVSLGAPGWIEMIRDGKLLASIGHRHGAPGSGIAKIVDFELTAGHYTLALSGMTAGEVGVSVSR